MTAVRRLAVLALAVVAGTVLVGCSPGPTVMRTPRIVWQGGVEPSSELERHPAVKTLRAAMVGDAMAWNSGDFTIRQLTDTYRYVGSIVQHYEDQGDDPWVFRGPRPFQPVKVERRNGVDYVVTVCALPVTEWTISSPGRDWSASPPEPHLESWSIGQYGEGELGLRVVGGGGSLGESCDGSTVPVGFFNPQPVLPAGPVTEPKRAPFPESR